MSKVGYVYHPDCLGHDPGGAHPERPARIASVHARLAEAGLASELVAVDAREVERAALERVHVPSYLDHVEEVCASPPAWIDSGDTPVSAGSLRAARLAAGGVLEAVDGVVSGELDGAFCCLRPPGHHAEPNVGMGFCLFNNVAVAAAHARAVHGLERVAIVDFDVHHGNGTQHAFEDDPSIFFASLHEWPLYPGTGAAEERGRGAGEGATLNLPQRSGAVDADWLGAFESELLPALDGFRPELVLISAGFDAHAFDPLASTRLTEDAYRRMTEALVELAGRHARGRIVSVLEGGYDLGALASSAEAHVGVLVAAAAKTPEG